MASAAPAIDICWGTSKKTNRRCANKSKLAEPGCLPTCHQHRDQLLRPGKCQYMVNPKTGLRCQRPFHWEPGPPHFELCPEHEKTPQEPCYFLRLPVELRVEIYRYILPPGTVVSRTVPGACEVNSRLKEYLPLLLVSSQIGSEARDHLYGSTTFHIELGPLGASIRCRYLYRPRSAEDRCDHDPIRDMSKSWDLRQHFNFSRVKNYNLEIMVQNSCALDGWSEEVEMYDLRDSVSAILPYLARAHQLHHLTVRVVFCGFDRWDPAKALDSFKLITTPLTTALRNITRPLLEPVWKGQSPNCLHTRLPRPTTPLPPSWGCALTGILVPPLDPDFAAYKHAFEHVTSGSSPPAPKPPVARMFSAFKRVYLECATHLLPVPAGAANPLHRARVAREAGDLDAFYVARNGFVAMWNAHLEAQYGELARVNGLVVAMFGADAWDPRFAQLTANAAVATAAAANASPVEEMGSCWEGASAADAAAAAAAAGVVGTVGQSFRWD